MSLLSVELRRRSLKLQLSDASVHSIAVSTGSLVFVNGSPTFLDRTSKRPENLRKYLEMDSSADCASEL